jgi:hypothetical protein
MRGYEHIVSVMLRDDAEYMILFRPNRPEEPFYIGCGHWHGRVYGGSTLEQALGRDRWIFERARLGWLLPLLEQLARGAPLPLQQLEAAHLQHEGRPLDIHSA